MATFVKRTGPNGKRVWQARVRKKGWPQQTETCDTKAAAQAWAGEIEGQMMRGQFIDTREADSTTLKDALDWYRREITPRKSIRGDKRTAPLPWPLGPSGSGLCPRSAAKISPSLFKPAKPRVPVGTRFGWNWLAGMNCRLS